MLHKTASCCVYSLCAPLCWKLCWKLCSAFSFIAMLTCLAWLSLVINYFLAVITLDPLGDAWAACFAMNNVNKTVSRLKPVRTRLAHALISIIKIGINWGELKHYRNTVLPPSSNQSLALWQPTETSGLWAGCSGREIQESEIHRHLCTAKQKLF